MGGNRPADPAQGGAGVRGPRPVKAPGNLIATVAATPYDEAYTDSGTPRKHYAALIDELEGRDLASLAADVQQEAEAAGLCYGDQKFAVDPLPRLITQAEWELMADGIAQRVRALEAFLADAYSDRKAVEAGVLPARVIDEAEHYEPLAREFPRPPSAEISGLDLLRDPHGSFCSLEDNLRTPSGIAFLTRVRRVIGARLGSDYEPASVEEIYDLVGETLRSASPSADEPVIVVLSDGPDAPAWNEHEEIARCCRLPILTPEQLEVRGGRLYGPIGDRRLAIDVVYRRTDEDRLTGYDGSLTAIGALLIEPLRRGTLVCVNSFGAGIADDKAIHARSAELIRFYLDEDPILPVVPAYDLADDEQRTEAVDRLHELVVKGRGGSGGHEVFVGCDLSQAELDSVAAEIDRDPAGFVAQELVTLSTHPTVAAGGLEPRHVDLRPFAFSRNGRVDVIPGGLTRFAPKPGQKIVNTAQGGGGKDTWVLGVSGAER